MFKGYVDSPDMYYRLTKVKSLRCHNCGERKAAWSNVSRVVEAVGTTQFTKYFKRFCEDCFILYFNPTDSAIVTRLRERHDVHT